MLPQRQRNKANEYSKDSRLSAIVHQTDVTVFTEHDTPANHWPGKTESGQLTGNTILPESNLFFLWEMVERKFIFPVPAGFRQVITKMGY